MKFPFAQEVSRHVRDKVCKFYRTFESPTCTVTANEVHVPTTDSITYRKAPESPSRLGLDLNFTDLLSPGKFQGYENEFGMIIGEMANGVEDQVAELSFRCKLCDFK